ncbi:Transporter [Nitrospina watsonii]|uniref:Transporter n=1 Tax=Nitrospina watsonii TaxID=1323948 RepID=A0ABN8W478_9BACT|nr:Transporter [Nitrospina watsonii]
MKQFIFLSGAAGLFLLLIGSGTGWSAPITFNTALPVAEQEFIFRELFVLDQSGDDPSGAERDRKAFAAVSVLGYGVTRDFALFGVLPYVDKGLDITSMGQRRSRDANGIGDATLFGRYTVIEDNIPGRTFRVAPFVGVELPTGDDEETDAFGRLPPSVQPGSGSADPFAGIVATYQTLDFQVDTQLSYKVNTEANDFELGDIARFDASLQHRLLPATLESGVPGFLYAVLEGNLIYMDQNKNNGIQNPNSGGTTLFLTPGLQYVTRRWIVEGGVQLPVIQDLNGTALEKEYIVLFGFRFNF